MSEQVNDARAWYQEYTGRLTPGYSEALSFESEATKILCYSMTVIHGLLQTERYARTILTQVGKHFYTNSEKEFRLNARMSRQQSIFDKSSRPEIQFLMDESAIRREVGSKRILLDQLYHVLELTQLPNISLQIIPFSSGIVWPTVVTLSYNIYYKNKKMMLSSERFLDQDNTRNETEIAYYASLFRNLCEQSLNEEESIALIQQRIATLETELMEAISPND